MEESARMRPVCDQVTSSFAAQFNDSTMPFEKLRLRINSTHGYTRQTYHVCIRFMTTKMILGQQIQKCHLMSVTFRVVGNKHIPYKSSDYGGVVSAEIDGDTQSVDISSGLWPIRFAFVVPSLVFTAVLRQKNHEKYGPQYEMRGNIVVHDEEYALYLSAMMTKGLNAVLTRRLRVLARRFGPEVFDKLSGISNGSIAADGLLGGSPRVDRVELEHLQGIVNVFEDSTDAVCLRKAFPAISTQMAIRYVGLVGVHDIQHDPYVLYSCKPKGLVDDPLCVADAIARSHVVPPLLRDDPRRIAAYLDAAMVQMQNDRFNPDTQGSIWFARDAVKATMMKMRDSGDPSWYFDECMLDATLVPMPGRIVEEGGYFARVHHDRVERSLATKLTNLSCRTVNHNMDAALQCLSLFVSYNEQGVGAKSLDARFPRWKLVYPSYAKCDATQRRALHMLAERHVLVLTGGAGTGKSEALCLVIRFFNYIAGVSMTACAPTGKAVDRLKQDLSETDIDCRTLHSQCARRDTDTIRALAIDEASMAFPGIVDKIMTDNLSYLIICGDDKQLPSIEPGAFLRDVMQSGTVPVVRLETVYRSGSGSGIATEAPKIFGRDAAQLHAAETDVNGFKIRLRNDIGTAVSTVGRLVRESGSAEDVVMISNLKITCKKANRLLQAIFNPRMTDSQASKLERGDDYAPWVNGDRVVSNEKIQLPDGGYIFNGMTGIVARVDVTKRKVTVSFRDIEHEFSATDRAIDHAYCVTAWKYQGSEVKHAVVFFEKPFGLSCELLYTAVTRGRYSTTVYLSLSDLKHSLATRTGPMRVTRLTDRLKSAARKRVRDDTSDSGDEDTSDSGDEESGRDRGRDG